MRKVALCEADTHGGHKLGLCSPDARVYDPDLKDKTGVHIGEFQRYIWDLRTEYINKAVEIAAASPTIYIHDGDITQGMKYMSQLMSTRMSDQFSIAAMNIGHALRMTEAEIVRLIAGTSSHVFGESSSEIMIAELLSAEFGARDIRPLAHSLLEIEGVMIDIAHHGPGSGIREWTRGNVARHYLRSAMLREFAEGGEPPRLYLRGHYHTFVHETLRMKHGGQWYESDLVVMPSWCGMTEYARQATKSQYVVENGLVVLEIEDGNLVIHPFVKTLDLRVREQL